MKRLLIPRTAGGLSAVGGIFSDIISEYNGSFYTETRNFNFDAVNKLIKELYSSAVKFFKRNNISEEYQKIELYMEGRYPFQVWELPVKITEFLSNDFTINDGYDYDNRKEDYFLDYQLEYEYGASGDFESVRLLTDTEFQKYSRMFAKYFNEIGRDELRLVEYCYYNGVDEPSVYEFEEV